MKDKKGLSAKEFKEKIALIFKKIYKEQHGTELSDEEGDSLLDFFIKLDELVTIYALEESGGRNIELEHKKKAMKRAVKELGISIFNKEDDKE